jgi:hypothetical protein
MTDLRSISGQGSRITSPVGGRRMLRWRISQPDFRLTDFKVPDCTQDIALDRRFVETSSPLPLADGPILEDRQRSLSGDSAPRAAAQGR